MIKPHPLALLNHPAFINAQAQQIKNHLNQDEFLLLSYHGLPQKAVADIGCQCQKNSKANCTMTKPVISCYRRQCIETTRLLKEQLSIDNDKITMSFQSRLGRTPWILPYTDEMLQKLHEQGIKKIAVACPSFVADCLETLEEIGIAAKESWQELGGESLRLIPCLNSSDTWINALKEIIEDA